MATAEECRAALESLTGRISNMDAKDRAAGTGVQLAQDLAELRVHLLK